LLQTPALKWFPFWEMPRNGLLRYSLIWLKTGLNAQQFHLFEMSDCGPSQTRTIFQSIISQFRPEFDPLLDVIFSRISVPFTDTETAFLIRLLDNF
jgi:hypothetical protein